MARSGSQPIWLVGCLALAALNSCVEGPPRVSASIETAAVLEVGATETYIFEVEAETGDFDEGFRVILSEPSLADLSEQGIAVERSWVRDGVEEADWPERIIIEAGELFVGAFSVTLTNNSQNRVDLELTITVRASPLGVGAGGGEETLRLAIRQR